MKNFNNIFLVFQKLKIRHLFIICFTIQSIVAFIMGFEVRPNFFWNLSLPIPVESDIDFYFSFVQHFPILYEKATWGFYPVFYLPQFFLYFYPLSLLNNTSLIFYIMSAINIICVPFLIYFIFKLPKLYIFGSIYILLVSLNTLSQWGNAELQIALVTIYIYSSIVKKKDYKTWHVLLLAFFSFKIVSLIVLLPISMEIGFKKTIKFATSLFMFIFLFNFWYVMINYNWINLDFIFDLLANRSSLTYISGYYMHLISFSLPLCYFVISLVRKLISYLYIRRLFGKYES